MRKEICLLIVLVVLTSSFIERPPKIPNPTIEKHSWEEYDPDLSLESINQLLAYADLIVENKDRKGLEYCESLARTVRKRFYHGYSYYSARENWIANFAGKYIWRDLSAIVLPDDIMKHSMAACSQQAIVLIECFKRAGIPYRAIRLKTHFTLEGKIKGQWYFFDLDLEPDFPTGRKSLNELMRANELVRMYEKRLDTEAVQKLFSSPEYGRVNEPMASGTMLFHQVTYVLSITLPVISTLLGILYVWFRWNRIKAGSAIKNEVKFYEVAQAENLLVK